MIQVIFNQKGGVGKSSIATNLAAISASKGYNTLLIDLDTQCNSSHYLLSDEQPEYEQTIANYFENSLRSSIRSPAPLDYVSATEYDKLSAITAHPELAELQSKLESRHKIFKLRDLINKLSEHFDRIYIDTPPAFNFYTLSALIAANGVLIPFDCDEFSRNALYNLMENIDETREDLNPELALHGIIINQYQARANQAKRIVEQLTEDNLPVLDAKIGSSVIMRESHEVCQPLVYFAPKHKLTQQFVTLFDEIEAGISAS